MAAAFTRAPRLALAAALLACAVCAAHAYSGSKAIPITLPAPGPGGIFPTPAPLPPSWVVPPYMLPWYNDVSSAGFQLYGSTPAQYFPPANNLNPPTLQLYHAVFGSSSSSEASAASTPSRTYKPAAQALPHIVNIVARDTNTFYGHGTPSAASGVSHPIIGIKSGSVWKLFAGGNYGDSSGARKLLGGASCWCVAYSGPADPYTCSGWGGTVFCPYSNCSGC